MIKINYVTGREKYEIKIKGHAGSAELGKDLVCAAVSTLAYTIAQNVKNMEESGGIKKADIKLECGEADICAYSGNTEVRVMFETVWVGFLLLEANYPEFVKCCELG